MRQRVIVSLFVIHSFILPLFQQRISMMADIDALREKELQLDDNSNPFNFPFFF